ncbi:MAG TPA: hypothetical protein VLG11_03530 [Candidatus Saccharimonadales bacterium]|nr:hypothetical protein [Candidatus Saccharimonadales bacterium]
MNTRQEVGAINLLLIPLIIVFLMLCGVGAFAAWAYNGRQDYKNNVDKKIATAVSQAQQQTQQTDQAQFDQQEKSPYKNYVGPASFGGITIVYPKTWSAYIVEKSGGSSTPVNAYFYPGFVPDTQNSDNAYSLRAAVVQQSYAGILAQYKSLIDNKKVTATPYTFPKLPSIFGMRLDGQIVPNKQGSMILMPLRNQTIEVWTESNTYLSDFNNTVLPNFVFSP